MKPLFDTLIPESLKTDTLAHSYAKNLIGSTLIAAVAAPFYAGLYYYLNFPQGALVILLIGLIIISTSFLLKPLGSLFLARELLLITFFAGITWLTYHLGGLQSATSFWLILPPLMAIFFGGMREGLFWSVMCIFTICVFTGCEYQHVALPPSPITDPKILQMLSLSGLILIILSLVYFFETGKREASQEVLSINEQLRLAKTEAEDSAKKAESANRLKTEFLANMSHELRTPLNGILGFTELICSGKAGTISEEQQEYLNDVLTSAHHLLQLINDILDLTQVEAGKMLFHPEPVHLHQLCEEVKDSVITLIKRKHLAFRCDIDAALRNIIIDPRKLKQVIYNYLSNAIKFTPENGKIQLRLYPVGIDFFKLEVCDTGIGIRQSDLKKLFIEFQQLDSSFSKKYQGTGLGLALTQHIVEAQGGSVGVESQFEKGSTFFAILPCLPRASH